MSTLDDLALPRVVLVTGFGPDRDAATAALSVGLSAGGRDIGVMDPADVETAAARVRHVAEHEHDALLVHGAGGLLTPLDARGGTLADVGTALRYKGVSTGAVLIVPTGPDLPALVALTDAALDTRSLPLLGVVVTGWPSDEPAPVDLGATPVLGVLPADVAGLDPQSRSSQAPSWFSPPDYGTMSS